MKVLMAGGGTLGSVTPLLAVAEELKFSRPDIIVEWVGTSFGPERKLVQTYGIKFTAITCGRWRRYFSLQNIFDLFKIVVGFMAALAYLINSRPQALVTAGSYVAVPLAWAAWVLRVPILVHQQDLRIGLANKLVLPF